MSLVVNPRQISETGTDKILGTLETSLSWISRLLGKQENPIPTQNPTDAQKLDALRNLDRRLEVFGASKHRYATHPLPEIVLTELERTYGIHLPPAFRRHLAEIGYGTGPYYGLWGPAAIREELDLLGEDAGTEGPIRTSPARPFPFSFADAEKVRQRQAAGEKEPWIISKWPSDGFLPICHQGCTYWTLLVVTGECAGCVWDVANYTGDEGLFVPSSRPTGCLSKAKGSLPPLPNLPTFTEWYWGWVEQASADLTAR